MSEKRPLSKKTQRILILQGGGALGAFEAGAIKAFCEDLCSETQENGNNSPASKDPLFDIVAGASIGAVNAAILVHNVMHPPIAKDGTAKEIWENASNQLCNFYDDISTRGGAQHPMWWVDNYFLENPLFKNFWSQWDSIRKIWTAQTDNFLSFQNKKDVEQSISGNSFLSGLYFALFPDKWGLPADSEIARRYYSYWWSLIFGTPGVLGPVMLQPDMKFLDPLGITHVFARFNNDPLVETMKNYWNFDDKQYSSIKTTTTEEGRQPRLLVVTTDVQDFTTPVLFDSYAKKSNKSRNDNPEWYSEYGMPLDDGTERPKYRIDYPQGITIDHIKASMATPLRYEYPVFQVLNQEKNTKEERTFWDGAFLANTPLRQVMKSYREYWKDSNFTDIPELEIFIIDLYPSIEKGSSIPSSQDTIQDRQTDITFHDRTKYEVRINQMRSDYVELLEDIVPIAQKQDAKLVEKILNSNSRKQKTSRNQDRFVKKKDLFDDRFKIGRVVYVERVEKTGSTIFGKAFDFSPKTISDLKKRGYDAAKSAFLKCTQEHEDYCNHS